MQAYEGHNLIEYLEELMIAIIKSNEQQIIIARRSLFNHLVTIGLVDDEDE